MEGMFKPITINTIKQLKSILQDINENYNIIAVDTETVSLIDRTIIGLSFCFEPEHSYYIPFGHRTVQGKLYPDQLSIPETMEILQKCLGQKTLVFHNFKFDYSVLILNGWEPLHFKKVWDTMILLHLIDEHIFENEYALKLASKKYLKNEIITYIESNNIEESYENFKFIDYTKGLMFEEIDSATKYGAQDAWLTFSLFNKLWPKIENLLIHGEKALGKEKISNPGRFNYVLNCEHQLIPVLAHSEKCGIELNLKYLKEMYEFLTIKSKILLCGSNDSEILSNLQETKYYKNEIGRIKKLFSERKKIEKKLSDFAEKISQFKKSLQIRKSEYNELAKNNKSTKTKEGQIKLLEDRIRILSTSIQEFNIRLKEISNNLIINDLPSRENTDGLVKYLTNPNSSDDIINLFWIQWKLYKVLPESGKIGKIKKRIALMVSQNKDKHFTSESEILRQKLQAALESENTEDALSSLLLKDLKPKRSLGEKGEKSDRDKLADKRIIKMVKFGLDKFDPNKKVNKKCPLTCGQLSKFLEDLLSYKEIEKFISTYIVGMLITAKNIDKEIFLAMPLNDKFEGDNCKVHTTYRQTKVRSGRLSSTKPNLQNLPRKSDNFMDIRKALIPEKGKIFVTADYDQMEIRVAAAFSQDPVMCKAILNNESIHIKTASSIYGVPEDQIDKKDPRRQVAKTLNFLMLYKGTAYALFDQTLTSDDPEIRKLTLSDCETFVQGFYKTYPIYNEWYKIQEIRNRNRGFTRTYGGRYQRIDYKRINSIKPVPDRSISDLRNWLMQDETRSCINGIIQGSCATFTKMAQISIRKRLIDLDIDANIVLSIHDEIVIEVNNNEREIKIVKLLLDAYMMRFIDHHNEFAVYKKDKFCIPISIDPEVKMSLSKG